MGGLALERPRLRVELDGQAPLDVPWDGAPSVEAGDLRVEAALAPADDGGLVLDWRIANPGAAARDVRAVALVWDVPARGRVRLLSNGWQSWSRSRVLVPGEDDDPSRHPAAADLARWIFLGDDRRVSADTVRTWAVGVLDAGGGDLLGIGFDGGSTHDGVVHVQYAPSAAAVEVAAEARLGGVRLAPGTGRALHRLRVERGGDPHALLGAWAGRTGAAEGARAAGPFLTGWCSWYQYFADVTEAAFLANLAAAADWPFDVFQLDDGWQPHIGDWLATNARFPAGLEALGARVRAAGRRPGLWLAPFLVSPESALAREHSDWTAAMRGTEAPLPASFNPAWGGLVHALDTTRPEVIAHLEAQGAALAAMGWTYLKLDFVYAPGLPGRFSDPTRTPAERVRAGLAAVRRGAGPDAYLLGCGAPLGCAVGLVDAMRIGPDVAPRWESDGSIPGFEEETPATANAWRNTLVRSAFHRRLWQNDPDCVMLRRHDTALTPAEARAWALAVGVSGGLVVLSDDLARLDGEARALFDEVVARGRAGDAAARDGRPARARDLLDARLPREFAGAGSDVAVISPHAR